ncbi:SWIM zinc finger family protein [Streptomyces sp. V4I8]|uniref:SWIM zinc finger family protein n=1 Tax=Streptomyces sp. V4I8 TaxID=3156469 RepID=UPI003517B01B
MAADELTGTPARPGARPGDEARAALRRAVAARRGGGGGEGAEGEARGSASRGAAEEQGAAAASSSAGVRRASPDTSDISGASDTSGVPDGERAVSSGSAEAGHVSADLSGGGRELPDEDTARDRAAPVGASAADASVAGRDVSDASADHQDEPAAEAGSAPEALDPVSGRSGARPADAAREALRAALGERRRAAQADEADRGAKGTRRSRRPARTTSGGGGSDSLRARDVGALLAGAFRMPSSDSPLGDDLGAPDPAAAPQRNVPTSPASEGRPGSASSTGHSEPPEPPAHPEPAAPQIPRSMAAPGRDGELRRTFPAFAPRPTDDTRFAETWWGNAWVTALEEGALDAKRLARGRGYAQEGHVDAITVTPGLVLAYVRGSRPRPYRVQVRLRTLGDDDWARFLDAVAERPGHIAALLDKVMPQSLAECGVPLLPGPGDLDPYCSCPDRGHPCKHAAALCYQTARLLDADPFVLLLLRGRGERGLLDALSRRNAARAARAAQEQGPAPQAGVRATEALAPDRRLPSLPAPLPVPPHPEQPPVYPAAPGGPDPFALDQLATDAAARAHALLSAGRDPVAELTLWQDAVRLAAARPGSGLTAGTRALYSSLSTAADRTPAELARAVAAWRQGGLEGLAVLEEPWDPPAGRFDRARPLLLAADLPAFRPWRNRLTHPRGHVQLRLGRDGLWYPYESEPGHDDWWPRGTPDLDPVGALTGLGASPEG